MVREFKFKGYSADQVQKISIEKLDAIAKFPTEKIFR